MEGEVQSMYFNRELSWLAFNKRVLEQAKDTRYPLLERMKFLSFFSSNLDEFYEIRVAGLMQQVDSNIPDPSLDGLGPKEQLEQIQKQVQLLVKEQYSIWQELLIPELEKEEISFKDKANLTKIEAQWLDDYYEREIYPVLTPLAVDFAHPFPQLVNKGLNLLVSLHNDNSTEDTNLPKLAVIPVPRILPRIVTLCPKQKGHGSFMFLSDILGLYAERLFPGYRLKGVWEFRITKNSDLYIDEEEIENLLFKIQEELYNMRRGAAVRLEIRHDVDADALKQLLEQNALLQENVFLTNGPLNFLRLFSLYEMLDRPDLKFEKFIPHIPEKLSSPDELFQALSKEDHLLHHPYDSFGSVVDFLQQAAKDPSVLAIKLTLYRTSGDTPIVDALKEAARNGKQVTVLIELKARFDEANNIARAKELEEEGVHVVYGMPGLKTHCKCCLVVRREDDGVKQYIHLGTGNYNSLTAKTYTDLSFLTTNAEIAEEVASLFNTLTGYAKRPDFNKLLVAPFNLHQETLRLIKRETANAKAGKEARIIAKMNSLADKEIINSLYEASSEGVQITLIIRGICCLIPGVEKLSENIEVKSILGQFLEHSRIYYFENTDDQPSVYVGSADWMPRNFFRRVEVVFPIEDNLLKKRIVSKILGNLLKDTKRSERLLPDGAYQPIKGDFSAQELFSKDSEKLRLSTYK